MMSTTCLQTEVALLKMDSIGLTMLLLPLRRWSQLLAGAKVVSLSGRAVGTHTGPQLGKGQKVNIYPDFQYAFDTIHVHGMLWMRPQNWLLGPPQALDHHMKSNT